MRRRFAAALCALVLSLTGWIVTPWAAVRAAEPAPPLAVGDASLSHSQVYVFVDKAGLGHQHAIIGKLRQGKIVLGAARDAGLLEFDMTSFQADTAEARQYIGLAGTISSGNQREVTKNMLGAEVLDVQKHPTALFQIKSALPIPKPHRGAPDTYQLEGDFTLHGVTHPLRIQVTVEPANGWHHVRGRFAIQQTKYGITPFTRALGTVGVADELQIHGDLWIAAAPQTAQ